MDVAGWQNYWHMWPKMAGEIQCEPSLFGHFAHNIHNGYMVSRQITIIIIIITTTERLRLRLLSFIYHITQTTTGDHRHRAQHVIAINFTTQKSYKNRTEVNELPYV
jgi:hypothetical protein